MAKNKSKRKTDGRKPRGGPKRSKQTKRPHRKEKKPLFERLALAAAVAGIWLSSIMVMPGLADEFRLPKLAVAEGVLLLSVVLLGLSKSGFSEWRRSRTLMLISAPLLGVAVLSVLFGGHSDHGRIALWNFAVGLIVMIAWGTRKLQLERVLTWILFPALVAGTLIALQRFGVWSPFDLETNRTRLQLTGLIGNVGEAALFVSLPLAACWIKAYRCARGRRIPSSLLWFSFGLILSGAIVVTETATAIVAIGLGFVVLGLTLPIGNRNRAALGLAAVVLIVAVTLSPAGLRIREKGGYLLRGELSELTTGRTDGWSAAQHMLRQNPVLGVGFGAFVAEFTPAKEAQLAAGVDYYDSHVGKSTFSNAHSELLEWGAETGWLGLLVLVWCLVVGVRHLRKRLQVIQVAKGDAGQPALQGDLAFELQLERALLWTTIVTVVLGALTYFPFRTALLGYPLALMFAAIWSDRTSPGHESATEVASEDSRKAATTANHVIAAIVALLLVGSLVISKRRIQSSAQLLRAESTAESMGRRVYPTVLRSLMGPLEEAGRATPWDERIPLAVGSYHYMLKEPDLAVEWYQRSLDIAPRPETIFNMGRGLLDLDRREEAIEMFTRAVMLDRLRLRYVDESVRDEVAKASRASAGPSRRKSTKAGSQ